MKNSIIKIALVLFSILSYAASTTAQNYADYSYASAYETATLEDRTYVAALALKAAGYEIADADVTTLREGEKYNGTRTYYSSNNYMIVALTEPGADLDLYLYDSDGRLLLENLEADDEGMVALDFYFYYTENLRIMAKNYKSRSKYKSYDTAFIIAYKPDW